jgi:hypothetical protein
MSVQIQFHIIEKYIKFPTDITSVLPLIKKALDILHGNLFRIHVGFLRRNNPFFLHIYLLQNCNNYKLWIVLSILNGDCRVIVGPLSNQSSSWISEFSNTCAALDYHAEARFLLDPCKVVVVWKASLLFSDSWIRWQSWLSPSSTSHPQ